MHFWIICESGNTVPHKASRELCIQNAIFRLGHFQANVLALPSLALRNGDDSMSTLEQDLAQLNFEYLMLARECARSNPLEAGWRFGLDSKQTRFITDLTIEKIKDMSGMVLAVCACV
jgi:hypothetical protein